ncbi:hypothetical protein FRC04_009301 [Tulasnella sp. 424]|nr:hypothetical protein FRC04_009301 [Tulasnella sp. 424]KAG8973119.1 hypothetical protein FRC05_009129 [Tulasnella sp. 425]
MSSSSLRLGSVAPDFSADTTKGRINFHEWIGNTWAILFSHPADFTPVCTTELGEVSRRAADFAKRNVKVIGLSANDLGSHEKWIQDINNVGKTELSFPIIADADRKVSVLYDMLDQQDATNIDQKGLPFTIRTVFIIDPAKKIRLTLSYPAAVGRNFDEIIRAVDALQLGDNYKIATPVNWQPGQDVIVNNAVKDDEAKKLFPDYKTVLPYLRTTEDPSRKAAA